MYAKKQISALFFIGLFAMTPFVVSMAEMSSEESTVDRRVFVDYDFEVDPLIPDQAEFIVSPGKSTPIGFVYYNSGKKDITLRTVADDFPKDWKISVSPSISLKTGHSKKTQIQIFIPEYAPLGQKEQISLLISTPNMGGVFQEVHLSLITQKKNNTDTDQDNIPDKEEEEIGTDPFSPDTDRDGLFDGVEYSFANSFSTGDTQKEVLKMIFEHENITYLDSDDDGLSDTYEQKYGLSPQKADTDEDGYPDGLEAFSVLEIDPPIDWDEDGIPDALEKGENAYDRLKSQVSKIKDDKKDGSEEKILQPTDAALQIETKKPMPIRISAADIIAEEKIVSEEMPKKDPLEKITDSKWASIIIIVCGSFFLMAMGVILIYQIRVSRRNLEKQED